MKKIGVIFISLLTLCCVSCGLQENITKDEEFSVSIVTDVDTYDRYDDSVLGITLKPQLKGHTDKEIQYHWISESDTEMLDTSNGPQKEIINSGEDVLFIVVAEIGYSNEDVSRCIPITLQIEDKESKDVLAKKTVGY